MSAKEMFEEQRYKRNEENEDDAVDDTVDDVYGMDWNEEDSNESGRDKF